MNLNLTFFSSLLFISSSYVFSNDMAMSSPVKNSHRFVNLFETTAENQVYRIPGLIAMQDGKLLSFADRRSSIKDVRSDQQIDIVCRISRDGGYSWEPERLVLGLAKHAEEQTNILDVSLNAHAYSDPAVVVDRASNKVVLFCAHGYGIGESRKGTEKATRIVRVESNDGGETWEKPDDITGSFYGMAYSAGLTVDGQDPSRWKAMFMPSGKVLQLRDGRLAVAMYVHTGSTTCNYVYVSSDLGKTWLILGNCAAEEGDEAKLEELADGTLMISSRPSYKLKTGRLYNYYSSQTGRWGKAVHRHDVVTVNNNAEIKVITSKADGHSTNRMLYSFANTDDPKNRKNICVYYSYDEGAQDSWRYGKTLCAGTGDYSTLAILPDYTIGALTERRIDGSSWDYHIDFDRFSIEELTDGRDWIHVTVDSLSNPLTDPKCKLAGVDGDLIITESAMDNIAGERTEPIPVFGQVHVRKTVEPGRFYIFSFPFDVKEVKSGNLSFEGYKIYQLNTRKLKKRKTYELSSRNLVKMDEFEAGQAYIFQLNGPEAQTLTFVSPPKQLLATEMDDTTFTKAPGNILKPAATLRPVTVSDVFVPDISGKKLEWRDSVLITPFSGYVKF